MSRSVDLPSLSANREDSDDRERRSVSFPSLALTEAVRIIHAAGQHGKDFSLPAFATYCGHTTDKSGPFRSKMASFKDWAMVDSKGGRASLTPLGQEIALADRPTEDQELLRKAFRSCAIFQRVYDDSAKGVPIKLDQLGKRALFEFGVSAKARDRFVASFVQSGAAAGLLKEDGDGAVTFMASVEIGQQAMEPARTLDENLVESVAQADPAQRISPAPSSYSAAGSPPAVIHQVWPTDAGEVVFSVHSSAPLPASAFELLASVVSAAAELADTLSSAGEATHKPDRY
ncbi:hypothetical protein [Kribbella soli]|uniref:Uncharacterized protein n=1 Tax=Kribbella soli TaxID=1124743 RepID=A0A4R0HFK0_9ACTN|nr:hypothetical protein [Kribbella soli]TCC08230.1 hypothetical protein E0H45_20205 [Kribbella soli]